MVTVFSCDMKCVDINFSVISKFDVFAMTTVAMAKIPTTLAFNLCIGHFELVGSSVTIKREILGDIATISF